MSDFWDRVEIGDGCWEWTGGRFHREKTRVLSYGMVRIGRKLRVTHRVAWELMFGAIPEGLWVLHHCDNSACVRPDHLYLGTHADNTRDAVVRRRMARGEQMWNHKLTADRVRDIRAALATGEATERIGHRFGVSGRTVRFIRAGQRWTHVQ